MGIRNISKKIIGKCLETSGIFYLVIFALLGTYPIHSTDIRLNLISFSKEAQAFLDSKPVIKVGYRESRLPFEYNDGIPKGLCIDYTRTIARILGLKLEWVPFETIPSIYNALQKKEIDLYILASKDKRKESYLLFSAPYIKNYEATMARKGSPADSAFASLQEQRIAMIQGIYAYFELKEKFPDLEVTGVRNSAEGIQQVVKGLVDIYGDDYVYLSQQLIELGLTDFSVKPRFGILDKSVVNLGYAIRKDLPALHEALNRIIPLIYNQEYEKITSTYSFYLSDLVAPEIFIRKSALTKEEVQWIAENRTVSAYVLDKLSPVSFFNAKGEPAGIIKGYLDEINETYGLNFSYKGFGSGIPEAISDVASGNSMIIPSLTKTDKQLKVLNFTDPYVESLIGIYGRRGDLLYVESLEELTDETIVAIEGHGVVEWMRKDFPRLHIRTVAGVKEGVEEVSRGKADIYIGDIMISNSYLSSSRINNISLTETIPYSYNLSIGVNKEQTTLLSILNKAIAQIKRNQGSFIELFWIGQQQRKKTNSIFIIIPSVLVFILASALFIQNYINKMRQGLLKKIAITDSLTGLYNRHFLDEIFDREVRRCKRHKEILGVMVFDVDNFKLYNDTYGHTKGDSVLKEIAQTLKKFFRRGSDFCFRLGGEEFGVLLIVNHEEDVLMLANKLKEKVEALGIEHKLNMPYRKVTISGGVATVSNEDSIIFDKLYTFADKKLYQAKKEGRNKVNG